jgi:hypothetical protein
LTSAAASTEALSFSQAPPLPVLPLCTEALGITVRFENTNTLKFISGEVLKLCELDYWNGFVLNVAHGMIHVCMEFMHVLLQRPACSS